MSERHGTSTETADYQLLSLANEKGKFAIDLSGTPADYIEAFERGIDEQWFALVDISRIAASPDRLMRVFRLTDRGTARLNDLRSQFVEQVVPITAGTIK